ncbi:hypothetical protein LTR36_005156 [Oleoguttula mirabilis]|uniref:Uncharacterized protein n=1 Tax=Oleoguttula mirabilis TaxID=1507867 RepID=A0AAV9JW65_9PEZI|nr:hypothetical protein LTR36_005156 [Oleoguttula mirabilis]
MYYAENEFRVYVPNYDSSACLWWTEKVRAVKRTFKVYVKITVCRGAANEAPNWENAIEWIERRHRGAVGYRIYKPSSAPSQFTLDMMVLGGMFEVAVHMQNSPWQRVSALMEEHHRILVAIDSRWVARKDSEVELPKY